MLIKDNIEPPEIEMTPWIFVGLAKNVKRTTSTITRQADKIRAIVIVGICRNVFQFEDRLKNNRQRDCVDVKKAISYCICKYTQITLKEIAPYAGVGDHSTIIHLRESCKDLIETDKIYKSKIEEIEKLILGL